MILLNLIEFRRILLCIRAVIRYHYLHCRIFACSVRVLYRHFYFECSLCHSVRKVFRILHCDFRVLRYAFFFQCTFDLFFRCSFPMILLNLIEFRRILLCICAVVRYHYLHCRIFACSVRIFYRHFYLECSFCHSIRQAFRILHCDFRVLRYAFFFQCTFDLFFRCSFPMILLNLIEFRRILLCIRAVIRYHYLHCRIFACSVRVLYRHFYFECSLCHSVRKVFRILHCDFRVLRYAFFLQRTFDLLFRCCFAVVFINLIEFRNILLIIFLFFYCNCYLYFIFTSIRISNCYIYRIIPCCIPIRNLSCIIKCYFQFIHCIFRISRHCYRAYNFLFCR